MKKNYYPKTMMLIGVFPIVAVVLVSVLYIVVGMILKVIGILPLDIMLVMEYHIITICIPLGILFGILYWNSSRITIKDDSITVKNAIIKFSRTKVYIKDIESLCIHEKDENDETCKFHIHVKKQNIKVIDF